MAQASGYNLAPALETAATKLGVGIPGRGAFFRRPYTLYHRQNVPASGQTQYIFFNEARSIGVTNLEQAGTLPANQLFIAHGMRFKFLCGITRTGARVTSTSNTYVSSLSYGVTATSNADNVATTWKWAEKTRELLSQGQVIMRVGERDVFNQYGLEKFPSGSGLSVQSDVAASLATTASSVTPSYGVNVQTLNNGERVVSNRYTFSTKIGILAGQQFSVQVDYNAAVDFSDQYLGPLNGVTVTYAGTLMCEIEGELVTPAQ